MLHLVDQKIRNAFSQASIQYDVLASLQREIGRELTVKLKVLPEIQSVLDVGMGTGWFTKRLKNFFPESLVVGMDFADGMIEQAKQRDSDFSIVQGDAHRLPFKNKSFDLITSNLAYQWVNPLQQSLSLCHDVLTPRGSLVLTMFGFNTLKELFTALEQSREKSATDQLGIQRLAKVEHVREALSKTGFAQVNITTEEIQVRFPDMLALVKWIKGIGANSLKKEVFVGKDLLLRANRYYDEHFKDRLGIYTTFEVLWVEAYKRELI